MMPPIDRSLAVHNLVRTAAFALTTTLALTACRGEDPAGSATDTDSSSSSSSSTGGNSTTTNCMEEQRKPSVNQNLSEMLLDVGDGYQADRGI